MDVLGSISDLLNRVTQGNRKQFNSTMFTKKRKVDRYFGGNIEQEPFVSGYIFAKFVLPRQLFVPSIGPLISKVSSQVGSWVYSSILESTITSINIPSRSLSKTTINGIGGKKWSIPTSVDVGDSINAKFNEFSGTPVSQIITQWFDLIRDPVYHMSPLKEYNKNEYGGKLLVWITNPTSREIEKVYLMTGLFPMRDPRDLFGGDITNIDRVEIDIEFNVDNVYDGDNPAFMWLFEAQNLQHKLNGEIHNAGLNVPLPFDDERVRKDIINTDGAQELIGQFEKFSESLR